MTTLAELREVAKKGDRNKEFKEVFLDKTEFSCDKDGKVVDLWAKVDSDWYLFSREARQSTMELLAAGMPKFERSLQSLDKDLWLQTIAGVQKVSRNKKFMFLLDTKEKDIIAAGSARDLSKMTLSESVNQIGDLLKQNPKIEIKNANVQNNNLHVVYRINGSEYKPVDTKGTELFRNILYTHHQLGVSPYVGAGLERLACTNMNYRTEREGWKYYGPGMPIAIQSIKLLNQIKPIDIRLMMNTNCSFNELQMAYNKIDYVNIQAHKTGKPVFTDSDISSRFPLKEVAAKYQVKPDAKMPDLWAKTASTPLSAYDLFNNVTYLASNIEGISNEAALDLRIFAGGLMTRQWDMNTIAPKINWN